MLMGFIGFVVMAFGFVFGSVFAACRAFILVGLILMGICIAFDEKNA